MTRKQKVTARRTPSEPVKGVDKRPWAAFKAHNEHQILIYPGDHTAYLVREFNSPEALTRFASSQQLKPSECTIIRGTIVRCDPQYKPHAGSKAPWDDDAESDSDTIMAAPEEVLTTSQPLTEEQTRELLGVSI